MHFKILSQNQIKPPLFQAETMRLMPIFLKIFP